MDPLNLAAALPYASITDAILDPIVNVATDFIDAVGLRRRLRPDAARERLHPDPERGDHAVRRLQRLGGRHDPVRHRRRRACSATSSAPGSPTRSATTAASSCSRRTASSTSTTSTSSGPTAGSSATATRPSSSPGCCRSSAPSSRCRPGSRGCRSGGFTVPHLRSAACPGSWRWRSSAARSATTGRTGATTSITSTTSVLAAVIVGLVVYLIMRRRRAAPSRGRRGRARDPARRPADAPDLGGPRRAALLGAGAGAGRAAAGLQLGPLALVPWLARLGLGRDRPGAAQELRGRAARRHRGRAADRPAPRDRLRARAPSTRRRARSSRSRSCRRRSSATASSARSSGGSAGPGATAAGLAAGAVAMVARRPPAAGARPRRRAGRRRPRARDRRRRRRWCPGVSRNGATLTAARLRGASIASTPTCSRGPCPAGDRRGDGAQGGAAAPARGRRRCGARWPPGSAASFVSTLASQRLIRWSSATGRCGRTPPTVSRLATAVVARMRAR